MATDSPFHFAVCSPSTTAATIGAIPIALNAGEIVAFEYIFEGKGKGTLFFLFFLELQAIVRDIAGYVGKAGASRPLDNSLSALLIRRATGVSVV